jgi:hypothetical protein
LWWRELRQGQKVDDVEYLKSGLVNLSSARVTANWKLGPEMHNGFQWAEEDAISTKKPIQILGGTRK